MDFCQLTRNIFTLYLRGCSLEEGKSLLENLSEKCVIIGTGEHEFYRNRETFLGDLGEAFREHPELSFSIDRMDCQDVPLSEQIHMVYGKLDITGIAAGGTVPVQMTTRFTMVYGEENGKWKILHIHQSVPYLEQAPGEYYPRSLSRQMEQMKSMAEAMKELAQKDSLTGLYNLRTLQEEYETGSQENTWVIMGDLDNFKRINDVYGHVQGNDVLKLVADTLVKNVRQQDVVARIGGDEFLILCRELPREKVETILQGILRDIEAIEVDIAIEMDIAIDMGISLGAVRIRKGETFSDAMHRADDRMYAAKRAGKNRFCLIDPEENEA